MCCAYRPIAHDPKHAKKHHFGYPTKTSHWCNNRNALVRTHSARHGINGTPSFDSQNGADYACHVIHICEGLINVLNCLTTIQSNDHLRVFLKVSRCDQISINISWFTGHVMWHFLILSLSFTNPSVSKQFQPSQLRARHHSLPLMFMLHMVMTWQLEHRCKP